MHIKEIKFKMYDISKNVQVQIIPDILHKYTVHSVTKVSMLIRVTRIREIKLCVYRIRRVTVITSFLIVQRQLNENLIHLKVSVH